MEENVKNSEDKLKEENPPKTLRKEAKIRRERILNNIVKKVGFRNARGRTKALAKEFNVVERTIRSDFLWMKKHIKPEDKEEIKITVRAAIDNALDKAMEAFVTQPSIENSKSIMQIAKGYREELEAWGEKEKIADKQEIKIESLFSKEEIEEEIKRMLGK